MATSTKRAAKVSQKPIKSVQKRVRDKSVVAKKSQIFYYLIPLVVFVAGVVYQFQDYLFPEKIYKMSEIIRIYIDVANRLVEHESQLNTYLIEDPTFDVVKEGLRPIQERIASLRTQTSQYEKMEQIPGGPTSFIKSSIQELDNIIDNQLKALTLDVFTSIAVKAGQIRLLSKSGNALVNENHKTTDSNVIRFMIMEDFIITPLENEQKEIEELANQNYTTMQEAIEKLEHLAGQYDKLMEIGSKVAQDIGLKSALELQNAGSFIEELPNSEYGRLVEGLEAIMEQREVIKQEKSKYMKHFKVFWVLKSRIMSNMGLIVEKLQNYEQEKRGPFLNLQAMITKDITNLKVRINNLQYKYAKKSIEL